MGHACPLVAMGLEMSNATRALSLFAVFVIGLLIGRVTAPSELKELQSSSSLSPALVDQQEAGGEQEREELSRLRALERRLQQTDVDAPAPVVTAERVIELQREVTRLRSLVREQQAAETETAGVVIPFPEGRAAQSDEQALHQALRKAFAAHGLDGEVSALDCSEFPCIAHGKIKGDVDHDALEPVFKDTRQAIGGAPYVSHSKFVDDKDPTKTFSSFSLALYPEGLPAPEQDNMNKRLRHRKNAFVDASAGD